MKIPDSPFDPEFKDLTGVEVRIAQARRDNARLVYQNEVLSKRYELDRILKDAGADSASRLAAIAKIEELFGIRL